MFGPDGHRGSEAESRVAQEEEKREEVPGESSCPQVQDTVGEEETKGLPMALDVRESVCGWWAGLGFSSRSHGPEEHHPVPDGAGLFGPRELGFFQTDNPELFCRSRPTRELLFLPTF